MRATTAVSSASEQVRADPEQVRADPEQFPADPEQFPAEPGQFPAEQEQRDRYQRIYAAEPWAYDRLVSAEDCQGRLAPALASLVSLSGAHVVEAGCGTGRLTRLLVAAGAHVEASDGAAAMVAVAADRLAGRGPGSFNLQVADFSALPVAGGAADLAIAGWVFGHQCAWAADRWRESIAVGLSELQRAVRPRGVVAVLETLGTGSEEPAAPNEALAAYYAWLEDAHGFTRRTLRTDYEFASAQEAADVCGWFFGPAMGEKVRHRGSAVVPECTGLWFRER